MCGWECKSVCVSERARQLRPCVCVCVLAKHKRSIDTQLKFYCRWANIASYNLWLKITNLKCTQQKLFRTLWLDVTFQGLKVDDGMQTLTGKSSNKNPNDSSLLGKMTQHRTETPHWSSLRLADLCCHSNALCTECDLKSVPQTNTSHFLFYTYTPLPRSKCHFGAWPNV